MISPNELSKVWHLGMVPLPGLSGAFVDRSGNVYSDRRGHLKKLKPSDNGKGYLRVRLWGKGMAIHRLVALAFFGPCPEGKEVNHKDGNKANNRPENLEYVTRAQNCQHAIDTGLRDPATGEEHPNAKLSQEKVDAIRSAYWERAVDGKLPRGAAKELADQFAVNRDYPRLLATGRAWKCHGVVE